nr:WSC domain-containing protein 2-like [Lytechinus pictus]
MAFNKTWLTWDNIGSPGLYRACVRRREQKPSTGGTIVMHGVSNKMRIETCIDSCIQSVFTYAALSRGDECYCTNVSSTSEFLSYVDSSLCDLKCAGDKLHHCGGKTFMSVYRTSVPDARCSSINFGSPGSLPLVALASYPRSGNTWTRELIEKATGLYTGSIYWRAERNLPISNKVFLGGNADYKNHNTICVKTHRHDRDSFEAAIMPIRNPLKAIVAEAFRRQIFESHRSPVDAIKFFKSEGWENFVYEQLKNWNSMNMHWIQSKRRLLPVVYEELESDTRRVLTEIVAFLNRTVEYERITCATQEHPSSLATFTSLGNHGRQTRVYLTADPFTPEMHQKIVDSVTLVNATLFQLHKRSLPIVYLKNTDVF